MPRGNRTWRPIETRLVAEFLAVRFPDARTMQRVRLGTIPGELPADGLEPAELRLLGTWRRWADALVIMPEELVLIEGAVRPDPGDVSQLELYMHLLPLTPELEELRSRPARGLLLYAIDDPVIRRLAADRNFTVEIFRPAWVEEYLSTLYPRKQRAPLDTMRRE